MNRGAPLRCCPAAMALLAMLAGCTLSPPPSHTELLGQALPASTTIPPAWSPGARAEPVSDNLLSVLHLNPWLVHGGIGVAVPIYHGGALQAQVTIATAEQQKAAAKYGSVALTAFGEVENGLTYEAVWTARLRFDQQALADITQAVGIAKEKYHAGTIDLLFVLDLQARQILSKSDLIEARNAQLANRIELHLALGGGFDASPATASLP